MENAVEHGLDRPARVEDAAVDRRAGHRAAAAPVLLVGLAAGLLGQGGYVGWLRWWVGLLVAVAAVLALGAGRDLVAELRGAPALAAGALAGWAVIDGALHGSASGGAGAAALLVGFAAVVATCRRLPAAGRETVRDGLIGVGLLLAATGWLGVALHHRPWGLIAQGLWRASSAITYPNATAAVLVPLALLAVAELTRRPRSAPLGLAAAGLLTGVGATGSRAGVLALAVGLLVLGAALGHRVVARSVLAPGLGAAVALVGLLPSVPAGPPARPGLAGLALLLGLALAAALTRLSRRAVASTAAAVLAALTLTGVGSASLSAAAGAVTGSRVTLASSDRIQAATAAVKLVVASPLTGSGPGQARLRWTGPDGNTNGIRYAHNEYLQVTAELGLVGAALLIVLLAAIGWLLLAARRRGPTPAMWAGVVAGLTAFAAHSAVDFLWQLPAIPLTAAALIGLAAPARQPAAPRPPVPTHAQKE
jgi:hypothetical protein